MSPSRCPTPTNPGGACPYLQTPSASARTTNGHVGGPTQGDPQSAVADRVGIAPRWRLTVPQARRLFEGIFGAGGPGRPTDSAPEYGVE